MKPGARFRSRVLGSLSLLEPSSLRARRPSAIIYYVSPRRRRTRHRLVTALPRSSQ